MNILRVNKKKKHQNDINDVVPILLLLILTFSSVCIVDFGQVNVSWLARFNKLYRKASRERSIFNIYNYI